MLPARAIRPTLHDRDHREHLLVWGEQGQWLLVDDAAASLLTEVAPGKTFDETLASALAHGMGTAPQVRRDVRTIWQVLLRRGLLETTTSATNRPSASPRICNITMNLTNRCNLRCTWCYNGLRKTREASPDAVMVALGRSRALLSKSASLIVLGGEPFVRFDALLDLVDRAAELFAPPVLVSTNGTLVRAEHARALVRRNVEVQVSLDSSEPDEHDAVRGRGSFEKARVGVQRLVAAGVPTLLSMVYTARSWRRIEPYLEMARRLGVREARFIPLRLVGQGTDHRAQLPDQAVVFEHLLDVLHRRPELRSLLGRDYFSILIKQCARSTSRASCGVGEQVLFIDADGSLYPCPNHVAPALRVGSVLTGDLAGTLESSPVLQQIRRQYRVEQYRQCSDCPFRRWCAGDCRGEAMAAGHSCRAPSLHCDELKQIHLRALWLAARRDSRFRMSTVNQPAC